jgi:hypothetical protein
MKQYYYKVRSVLLAIFICLLLAFAFLVAVHVLSHMFIYPAVRAHVWITNRDRFWRSHLPTGDADQVAWHDRMGTKWKDTEWYKAGKGHTFVGGLCSILFYALTIPGALLFLWIYMYYNESRSQALIPRSFSNDDISSDFAFRAQFLGYSGMCSGFASDAVQITGFTVVSETITVACLPGQNGTLDVQWAAKGAKIATIPKIGISIAPPVDVAIAAAAVQWKFTASSVVEGELNSIEGVFKPHREGEVLRGGMPSTLKVNLMATSYENQLNPGAVAKAVGWRPKYGGSIIIGDVKTAVDFMIGHTMGENALKFNIDLEVETAQLEMIVVPMTTVCTRTCIQSTCIHMDPHTRMHMHSLSRALSYATIVLLSQWLDMVSMVGGMFAAVTATCIEFMNTYELRQEYYDRMRNKYTNLWHKSRAERLCWLIDSLDMWGGLVRVQCM